MKQFIRESFVKLVLTRLASVNRQRTRVRPAAALVAAFAMLCATAGPLAAQQQRITFIRDAETEHIIRTYATPVFRVAGLNPSDISVHLIVDRSLNAFVAGGLNMFIHTGLLLRAESPSQVIGVIAHETGHIAGGHLARLPEAMQSSWETLMLSLLGAAAAAAARSGEGAMASVMAGQQIAERQFLRYTRTLESSADQAGVNFLDRTQQSARGLMEFLQILADQELLSVDRQDPYMRSHPVTTERVNFVRNWVETSRYSNMPVRPELVDMHKRMRAKLLGFTEPQRALQQYKEGDTTIEGRYARAFAFYKRGDIPKALPLVDALLADKPDDPFFAETRAQFTYESGDPRGSLPYYEKAVAKMPENALLRVELATAQIATEDKALNAVAIGNLVTAAKGEPESAEIWRQLSVAYGRDGQLGMSSLAQAEQALIVGRRADARAYADRAERLLPPGSPHILRAQDIKSSTDRLKPESK
ncbi:MAG: M48 family metalloprotease [Proteobacteria bacterium]|nr:M48 family metalloprotease [Pseudomonadota bacterium]